MSGRRLLCLALLASGLCAQDGPLDQRWRELSGRLADGSIPGDLQLQEIEAFLRFAGEGSDAAPAVLAARCRLGSLQLTAFEPTRAKTQFRRALAAAPGTAIGIRGHALCGLAECAELGGDVDTALELWTEAANDLAGTPWSDVARVSRKRLISKPLERLRAGQKIPEPGPLLDTGQSARRITDLRGKLALLVFVSAADESGLERTEQVVVAARGAGLRDDQMLVFAIEVPGASIDTRAAALGWRMPLIASPDGFLGPAFLQFQVRGVPSTLLVGPDGTLLARDLPPARLREVLQRTGGR